MEDAQLEITRSLDVLYSYIVEREMFEEILGFYALCTLTKQM